MMMDPAAIDKAIGPLRESLEVLAQDAMKCWSHFRLGGAPSTESQMRVQLRAERQMRHAAEATIQGWEDEFGEDMFASILPKFDAKKSRCYQSWWNWVRQDALNLYFMFATMPTSAAEALQEWASSRSADTLRRTLANRPSAELKAVCDYYSDRAARTGNPLISQGTAMLAQLVAEGTSRGALCFTVFTPSAPMTTIEDDGRVTYTEVPRPGVGTALKYVGEMRRGLEATSQTPTLSKRKSLASRSKQDVASLADELTKPLEQLSDRFDGEDWEERRASAGEFAQRSFFGKSTRRSAVMANVMQRRIAMRMDEDELAERMPFLHMKSMVQGERLFDRSKTVEFFKCMNDFVEAGVSFEGRVALVTGCGRGSIGIELVKALLAGGANVFVTTSSGVTSRNTSFFRDVFQTYGGADSQLTLLPFNQGSARDVNGLVAHIYDTLNLDLDFIIPFAAISENGRDITRIDSRSEFAHRMMLTNVLRLLGAVKIQKEKRGIFCRPAFVLLPLSPNHGVFGGDGLYAESKIALETLMNKWHSEGWSDYLCLAGAVIGWTRSTGLMSENDIVAQSLESRHDIRTFSQDEMAANLTALFHPRMIETAQRDPIWADFSGGFGAVPDLKEVVARVRADVMSEAARRRRIAKEERLDSLASVTAAVATKNNHNNPVASGSGTKKGSKLSCFNSAIFPALPTEQEIASDASLAQLEGMVGLRNVVVVVGFGEIGPWGMSRTRWQQEVDHELSLEGVIELAWLVGLIKYTNGNLPDGSHHTGWIDVSTGVPVEDSEMRARYEEQLLSQVGIRLIDPKTNNLEEYDPARKHIMQQIAIERDMKPIEVADKETAEAYLSEYGQGACDIWCREDGQWMVLLRKGAVVSLGRTTQFDRRVAGLLPAGWSAERLGVPADIAKNVDPVTLFTLASTSEALLMAGITDAYELYEHCHVSEVGTCCGGGMGGMKSMRDIFLHRYFDRTVNADVLQESFINTMPAWINMLLLSASGPVKTPVAACATAAVSLDIGIETIRSGKARVMFCGGCDDFSEEGSFEFAQMKATVSSVVDGAAGRPPREMSRPTTTTRAGFMESQGSGTQIIMDAELALEMGCPIFGILSASATATDKTGRSVPAPGQGILTTARQISSDITSPLLDLSYRRQRLMRALRRIEEDKRDEAAAIVAEVQAIADAKGASTAAAVAAERNAMLARTVNTSKISAYDRWTTSFYANEPTIAPLRGALAVWGLGIDDVAVASFHGTSTKANDLNESEVTHKQLEHLGRTPGNPIFVVAQKWLTGHPKGAAAAWMLNGLIQIIQSGRVPGNANADDIDAKLRKFHHLVYTNTSIQTTGIEAAVLKSFGFGQAGAEILIINPRRLLASLTPEDRAIYSKKRNVRESKAFRYLQDVLTDRTPLVNVKDHAPYTDEDESRVYLDPTARATYDSQQGTWTFSSNREGTAAGKSVSKTSNKTMSRQEEPFIAATNDGLLSSMRQNAASMRTQTERGIGVDVEDVATFASHVAQSDASGPTSFIQRNFTDAEIEYCMNAANPSASFAGRWAAKEAIIKAISSSAPDTAPMWKGPSAPLKDIEIIASTSGAPVVNLTGEVKAIADVLGASSFTISISHTATVAIAQASAQ
jgi:fatty acid synthase subunit beta